MTDARVPRRAQVVLLDDRTLDFLVQVKTLVVVRNCLNVCKSYLQSNVIVIMLYILFFLASTSFPRTFRHGSLAF